MSINGNVDGVEKNVTDPQCNIGGVWKNIKEGYCNVGEVWEKFYNRNFPMYTAGVQNVAWTFKPNDSTCVITQEASDVILHGNGFSESSFGSAYMTSVTFDKGSFTKLCVDCKIDVVSGGRYELYCNTTPHVTVDFSSAILRSILQLDISSVSGNAYFTLFFGGIGSGASATATIYNVWLE